MTDTERTERLEALAKKVAASAAAAPEGIPVDETYPRVVAALMVALGDVSNDVLDCDIDKIETGLAALATYALMALDWHNRRIERRNERSKQNG